MSFISKIFGSKRTKIIFIVEDNPVYSALLKSFLESKFTDATEIKSFPVGELCLAELHRHPHVIIMDYNLQSKFSDAGNGLMNLLEIREQNSKVQFILLSAQKDFEFAIDLFEKYNCVAVHKDGEAFSKIEDIIRKTWN